MFLIRFKYNGQAYFLHSIDGHGFYEAHTIDGFKGARLDWIRSTGKSLGIKSIQIVEVADENELLRRIGGAIPFPVIDFSGKGLELRFMGVPIVA